MVSWETPVEMSKVRQESPHWDWKGAGTRLMARQRAGKKMVVIIQRREMVDRVVEKEGAEGMELEKTKRCQRQGLEEWDGVLQGSPVLGVGIPTSQHRKLRHRESSGAIFP